MVAPHHLRRADSVDIEAMLAIERHSFPSAWAPDVLRRFLENPLTIARVVESSGRVVAFFMVAFDAPRLHLLNIAVARAWRRRGLGTLALAEVERIAVRHGCDSVDLEVRESNLAAQLFYQRAGFRAVEILRGYYGDEDGYLMRKTDLARTEQRAATGEASRRGASDER